MKYSERFKEICEANKLVGAQSVFVKDGEIVERCVYGYQDWENKVPSTNKTIYRIASISKTVGAIGLMQLYEKGLFDLNGDISDILGFTLRNPNYPDKVITPVMIMTQTSSILDGYDDENPKYNNIIKAYNGVNGTNIEVSLKDLLTNKECKYYSDLSFGDYEPGAKFNYSNLGCGIMACMIEKLSGELYSEYMINHVFKPLGLDASFVANDIKRKENIANLYLPSDDGFVICKSADSLIKGGYKKWPLGDNFRGPAGGLFIDMDDLTKIMMMFINRGEVDGVRLLKEETVDLMYQSHWFGSGDGDGYRAKGLQMKILHNFDNEDVVMRGHTGGAYGVRSYMYFNQKYKSGAIFITNGGHMTTNKEYNLNSSFYDTLREFIDNYYPERTSSTFTFSINEDKAYVDNRTIYLDTIPYEYNDEVFLGAYHLADGLGIVGKKNEEDESIIFTKNGKSIKLEKLPKFDGILVAPVLKVCDALGVEVERKGNTISIKY